MLTLDVAPLGTRFTLTDVAVDVQQGRRLATLGLRQGAAIAVVGKTAGGGRIVDVAGSRIALDRTTAGRVNVR